MFCRLAARSDRIDSVVFELIGNTNKRAEVEEEEDSWGPVLFEHDMKRLVYGISVTIMVPLWKLNES